MQKIERYGVIALVFMAVSVVAVYLWEDRGSELTGDSVVAAQRPSRVEPRPSALPEPAPHAPALQRPVVDLPMNLGRDGGIRALPGARPKTPAGTGTVAESEDLPRALPGALQREPAERRESAVLERPGESSTVLEMPSERPTLRAPSATSQPRGPEPRPTSASRETLVELEPPPKPAPSAPAAASAQRRYTVQKGDSLERIARSQLGDAALWTAIQKKNGIQDPRRLLAGTSILLPGSAELEAAGTSVHQQPTSPRAQPAPGKPAAGGSRPADAATAAAPSSTEGARSYVVKKGDVLGTIAQRELGSVSLMAKIVALNPGLDPDRILVGTKLLLPPAPEGSRRAAPAEAREVDRRVASADAPRHSSGDSRFKVR